MEKGSTKGCRLWRGLVSRGLQTRMQQATKAGTYIRYLDVMELVISCVISAECAASCMASASIPLSTTFAEEFGNDTPSTSYACASTALFLQHSNTIKACYSACRAPMELPKTLECLGGLNNRLQTGYNCQREILSMPWSTRLISSSWRPGARAVRTEGRAPKPRQGHLHMHTVIRHMSL